MPLLRPQVRHARHAAARPPAQNEKDYRIRGRVHRLQSGRVPLRQVLPFPRSESQEQGGLVKRPETRLQRRRFKQRSFRKGGKSSKVPHQELQQRGEEHSLILTE